MPRLSHEALVELVRQAPQIIPAIMWPERQIRGETTLRVHPTEFIDLNFAEHRADVVLGFEDTAGKLVEAAAHADTPDAAHITLAAMAAADLLR